MQIRDWEGIKKINHITHCHEKCSLNNIQVDTLNIAALMGCYAMNGGTTCRSCNHGYQEHMHVLNEYVPVSKTIEDKNIKAQLDTFTSETKKKEAVIAQLKQLIQDYTDEHKFVETTAAEFGCFLKHNAILPYSDARIEYIDHLIKEERAKAQVSNDDAVLQSMVSAKQMYLEEFRIIDQAIGSGVNAKILDPKNVAKVEAELYKLKHFGQTLKQVRDGGTAAHRITYTEIPFEAPEGKKSSWASKLKKRARSFFKRQFSSKMEN